MAELIVKINVSDSEKAEIAKRLLSNEAAEVADEIQLTVEEERKIREMLLKR